MDHAARPGELLSRLGVDASAAEALPGAADPAIAAAGAPAQGASCGGTRPAGDAPRREIRLEEKDTGRSQAQGDQLSVDLAPQGPASGAGDRMPAALLAHNIAAELDRLTGLAEGIQAALSFCHPAASAPPQALLQLQEIDRLTQILADLARVVRTLGAELPTQSVDRAAIAAVMGLREVAARLERGPGSAATARAATGDIQWL